MTDPRTVPSFTTSLWSDEVGLADPDATMPVALGTYRFSSGRTRTDNTLYDPRPPDSDTQGT